MTEMTEATSRPENAAVRMTTHAFRLTFLTPAFLGDAQQSGRWRTPPFKAQLRQWWRVVYAAQAGFRPGLEAAMRQEEGKLFGNAWLENDYCKSLVRLRLDRWDPGKLKSWAGLEQGKVDHPEPQKTNYKVGPHAYLGLGPLNGSGGTQLAKKQEKSTAAIRDGESAVLSLAVPAEHAGRIGQALALMHRYGTVGGRSRNGWGSYALIPLEGTPGLQGALPVRDWHRCLELYWPHAIGKDEKGPLVWQTTPHADWKALMRTLAILKIGLRTQFRFSSGRDAPQPEARHWLAYPVTKHSVRPWGDQARLPNQLRFKVRLAPDGRQLVGVIFHMPHLPPPAFGPDQAAIERVWRQVHAFLDAPAQKLTRIQGPKP